jgi:hypothetical protein
MQSRMDLPRRDRRPDHAFSGDLVGAALPRRVYRVAVIHWLDLHPGIQAEPVGRRDPPSRAPGVADEKTPPCWATARRGQSGVGAFGSRFEPSLPSGPRPTIHRFATRMGLECARLPMGRVLPPGLCPVRQNVVRFDACSRGVSA